MNARPTQALSTGRVFALWWPLAASWMLMAIEAPMFTAVVARMPGPERALAAYGSLVLPLALVIEAPVIMLLAASTALSKSREAYARLGRFTLTLGVVLTALHVLVAFTPLFDLIAVRAIDAPASVVEPGRIGLRMMTPWTLSIAWRRYQQGLLIRFERSRQVGLGTLVRLGANATVLLAGYTYGGLPGIVVGTAGISAGVVGEALFIHACARPVVRERLAPAAPDEAPLTRRAFVGFYAPLAVTPLMTLAIQPIGAAAMGRMPESLASLAAWPAVHALVFLLRSPGMAFNEVVVSLAGDAESRRVLRRVAGFAAVALVLALAVFAATPLAKLWFAGVLGLTPRLTALARTGVALAVLMPGYQVLQSLFQGALVRAHTTRPITEAVALYAGCASVALFVGVRLAPAPGIAVAVVSFTVAGVLQTCWLWWRSRHAVLPGKAPSA